jgi:hypothetical protein
LGGENRIVEDRKRNERKIKKEGTQGFKNK